MTQPMIAFINLDEVKRLVDELPKEQKEALLIEKVRELSDDSRARIAKSIIRMSG
ncbi:MAG: hypothetical protein HC862_32310 [Scytonema sp. RU_4_4]|nr:hypothetical protein [Scytonema sp. RU_4_4]